MSVVLAALLLLVGQTAAGDVAGSTPVGPDSIRARQILAAMLSVPDTSSALTVRVRSVPLHPGATMWLGEAPGHHAPRRAMVGRLSDGSLIPLGCRPCRLVLEAEFPPAFRLDSLWLYVATLAELDGSVPPLGSPVIDPSKLPRRMRTWAGEHGLRLERPKVVTLSGGIRQVTLLLETDALYRVVAILGTSPSDDAIKEVKLLIGYPPD